MQSLLYTAELDLAEEDVRPFLDWYAFRHAPDLFPLGFASCACYRTADGDMNLFDIYEIPGHDLFTAPGYRRMNGRDPYAAPILATRRNKAHTIYTQQALGTPSGGLMDADWLTVARFDTDEQPDAVAARLTAALPSGIAQGRVGTRTVDHPVYTTHRPRFLVVLEWSERPPADASRQLRKAVGEAERLDAFTARRLYPWPTVPEVSQGQDSR
jgi:hypothetical protein